MKKRNLREELSAEMRAQALVQKGVSFPKIYFDRGILAERVQAFDLAYDLACERLGMHRVEVLDEQDRLRFLPCLTGIG